MRMVLPVAHHCAISWSSHLVVYVRKLAAKLGLNSLMNLAYAVLYQAQLQATHQSIACRPDYSPRSGK